VFYYSKSEPKYQKVDPEELTAVKDK